MCVNDCQSCQHSFSKTQNCPENTASKRCVQGLHAGQTDGAGPGPPHHATCLCIFPGGTSPRPMLCTLPGAPHSHCAQSPCSVLHGESRGHCELGTTPFPYCKRFTWSGPLRKLWELRWAWSFSGTGWELCTRMCTGPGSAPASFSAASACPAPLGCLAPGLRETAVRGMRSWREAWGMWLSPHSENQWGAKLAGRTHVHG